MPYEGYDLKHGTVELERGTPEILGARIGQVIGATSPLRAEPSGEEIGFILHFDDGDIGIANVADRLTVLTWPDDLWSEWGVSRSDPVQLEPPH